MRRCRRAKRLAMQRLFHILSGVNLLASSKERGLDTDETTIFECAADLPKPLKFTDLYSQVHRRF